MNFREEVKLRKQVEDTAPPDLVVKFKDIAIEYEKGVTDNLLRYWTLGRMVKEVIDADSKYGVDTLKLLRDYCGDFRYSYLSQMAHFYRDVNEKQLKNLLTLRMKYTGLPITWVYIQKVLCVDNPEKVDELLHKTCEHNWSVEELGAAVDKIFGRNRGSRHGGGRKIQVPPTITGRLAACGKVSEVWCKKAEAIFLHEAHGFVSSIETMPADKITPELIEGIDVNVKVLASMEEIVTRVRQSLQEARQAAQRRAATQAQANADKTADALDAESTKREKTSPPEETPDGAPTKPVKESKRRGAQVAVGVA
jgi:hypothetical protein